MKQKRIVSILTRRFRRVQLVGIGYEAAYPNVSILTRRFRRVQRESSGVVMV